MAPVTLLIVGAGSRGATFAGYAAQYPDEARVVAVAEPRAVRREALASIHGIAAERCFASWQDAAAAPRMADAVIIATLDRDHLEPALAFAAQGYAMLIEKPLAPTEEECRRIIEAVEEAGVVAAVAHVLRYTPYARALTALLDAGAVGEVMSIDHLEPVGHLHHAHSYVRGNWRREDRTGPMLLAKCCHDIDWLGMLMGGRRCEAVSSFGSLSFFTPARRPPGAGDRCVACAIEPECTFSAPAFYGGMAARGGLGWPVDVVAWPPTAENVAAALEDGPYGRCVWGCDNDVVDHQVVNLRYAGGATASFTMTAFTRMRERETRIFGTAGELVGDGRAIAVFDFATQEVTRHEVEVPPGGGHAGGDYGVMDDFVAAVAAGDPAMVPTSPVETLSSHRIAFAAEAARRTDTVVAL